jgi:hypothetical protein
MSDTYKTLGQAFGYIPNSFGNPSPQKVAA